jgi:hypothetical protein
VGSAGVSETIGVLCECLCPLIGSLLLTMVVEPCTRSGGGGGDDASIEVTHSSGERQVVRVTSLVGRSSELTRGELRPR